MSDSASRRILARVAARLARRSGLPALVLLTDDDRLADPVAAARRLPPGSMVIVRAKDAGRRRALGLRLRTVARTRGLFLLIAGDAALARNLGADGVHLPQIRIGEAAALRARHGFVVTAAAHSLAALRQAGWVDALILSAVLPTASHPGRAALGVVRANLMARQMPKPVYALGGITAKNAGRLAGFCGIAAIGALAVENS
jgi:thiamine-phosphate pyrophosphorylase